MLDELVLQTLHTLQRQFICCLSFLYEASSFLDEAVIAMGSTGAPCDPALHCAVCDGLERFDVDNFSARRSMLARPLAGC